MVGGADILGHGHTAGVFVLDDDRRRQRELPDQLAGRIQIEQVVKTQLDAVQLGHAREQVPPGVDLGIVGGPLMRVLTIFEILHLLVVQQHERREIADALAEPVGDDKIIVRRGMEGLCRQAAQRIEAQLVVVLFHLIDDLAIASRAGDHGHAFEVLRSRADHGRPADIDVLDDLFLGNSAAPGYFLERVEAHDHHVDGLDALLLQSQHVLVVLAVGQQTGMDVRVQRLHPAAEDLGETGDVANAGNGNVLVHEEFGGATRGDYLHAEVGQ